MDFLDPAAIDKVDYVSEITKDPTGGYVAKTEINGTTLQAKGVTEADAALALDEVVEQATVSGDVQWGGI